jgi:hypothetical protein
VQAPARSPATDDGVAGDADVITALGLWWSSSPIRIRSSWTESEARSTDELCLVYP